MPIMKEISQRNLRFKPVFAQEFLFVSRPVTDAISLWWVLLSVQKQLTEPLSEQQSKAKISCFSCIVFAKVTLRARHQLSSISSPALTPSQAFTLTRSPLRNSVFSFPFGGQQLVSYNRIQ